MKRSTKKFVLSDETLNSYDFVVSTEGLDITGFLKNPVMLFNHDYNKVIGVWTDVKKEGTKLTGVPCFDEADKEAMLYYSKVEQGILNGASIGLTPINFDAQRKIMIEGLVMETSITPVPSNKNAGAFYDLNGKRLGMNEAQNYLLSVNGGNPLKYSLTWLC